MSKRYPDELPVFAILSFSADVIVGHYETWPREKLDGSGRELMAVMSCGRGEPFGLFYSSGMPDYCFAPLTPAARELLAWVHQ